jgi:predicted phosphodiesterase
MERIKKRDRWTCKVCGMKFFVEVYKFDVGDDDSNYITLCPECSSKSLSKDVLKQSIRENKIVLVGDCHSQLDKLDELLSAEEPFDFFISVGDVAKVKYITPSGLKIIDKWRTKGYFIRGNHDDAEFFNPIRLHQEINGLQIAGLNGIIKSRRFIGDCPNLISFREILYLSHLRDIDILVTHQAPTGIFVDKGEKVLEELLNYLVPKIYIFGHIHEYKLKFRLQTFCISLPLVDKGHAVAYFQGRDLRNLEIILKKGKKTIRV